MTDKVIHEVRLIETDDGFTIEVKGDKEQIRKMGFRHGFGPGMGFGRGMRFARRRRFWRHMHPGFDPGHGFGPWWDEAPEHGEAPPEV